jgi:hypothetical protein
MTTKKQSREKATEETVTRNGKITQKSQAVKKPSKAAKPLAMKNTVKKTGVTKKPIATRKPKATASPAIFGEVKAERLGIKKEHITTRNICKVTFRLPAEAAFNAGSVTVVGDFNGWNKELTPLEKLENGDFTVTVELDAGKEYCFRYLIDGQRWENDWNADKYVKSPYGEEDSVVCA